MKAVGRGNVHIEIGVVDSVEPPQKRDLVVQEMPDIEHEVQEDHRSNDPGPIRYTYQTKDTYFVFIDVERGLKDRHGKKQPEYDAVEDAYANIVDPSLEFRNRARPVRDQEFQDQEENESPNRYQ